MGHLVMPPLVFRKRKSFSDKAAKALSQGIIPALQVSGFSGILANRTMGFFRKDCGISFPKITKGVTLSVILWNEIPQFNASFLTVVARNKGNTLASSATKSGPKPDLIDLLIDKTPDLIQFKPIFLDGGLKGFLNWGKAPNFFLTSR